MYRKRGGSICTKGELADAISKKRLVDAIEFLECTHGDTDCLYDQSKRSFQSHVVSNTSGSQPLEEASSSTTESLTYQSLDVPFIYVYICRYRHPMASKTIFVTLEVNNILKKMRLPGESFGDTIARLCKGKSSEPLYLWAQTSDGWTGLTHEDQQLLDETTRDVRK